MNSNCRDKRNNFEEVQRALIEARGSEILGVVGESFSTLSLMSKSLEVLLIPKCRKNITIAAMSQVGLVGKESSLPPGKINIIYRVQPMNNSMACLKGFQTSREKGERNKRWNKVLVVKLWKVQLNLDGMCLCTHMEEVRRQPSRLAK